MYENLYKERSDYRNEPKVAFPKLYSAYFRDWRNFSGRLSRRSYWQIVLCHLLLSFLVSASAIAISQLGYFILSETLPVVTLILLLLPFPAAMVRRLNDARLTRKWALVNLLPLGGQVIWLALSLFPTKK